MSIRPKFLISLTLLCCGVLAFAGEPFSVIVVDKAKNELHRGEYVGDKIELKKTFHTTLGKALGDKEVEKDLKTPEGIYFFTALHKPPGLKKKFGVMAFMVNYPNPIDAKSGKTGYDIMLHATDDPSRLKRNQDSEGCVVVDNHEIQELSLCIKLGLTPILIYKELKPEYLNKASNPEVVAAFDRWVKAWGEKDLENYIGSYDAGFSYNGMNLAKYREYKRGLNERYAKIHVEAINPRFYFHPKYDVVTFTQDYSSELNNGAKGFRSQGTKTLYFLKDSHKIAVEAYSSVLDR